MMKTAHDPCGVDTTLAAGSTPRDTRGAARADRHRRPVLKNTDATLLGKNAPGQQELRDALQEVTRAARSLRVLTDYLERHPEALIRGKTEERTLMRRLAAVAILLRPRRPRGRVRVHAAVALLHPQRGPRRPPRRHPNVSVAVGPVSVPAAVDRPQIVVSTGPNQVRLDEFNRWASPLQNNIARVVAENLVAMLGTPRVTLFPQTLERGR